MSEPEIIKFIQKSYEQLKSQKDLSPRNETVNQTLNQLVLRLKTRAAAISAIGFWAVAPSKK